MYTQALLAGKKGMNKMVKERRIQIGRQNMWSRDTPSRRNRGSSSVIFTTPNLIHTLGTISADNSYKLRHTFKNMEI